jgi:LPS-assembly protein
MRRALSFILAAQTILMSAGMIGVAFADDTPPAQDTSTAMPGTQAAAPASPTPAAGGKTLRPGELSPDDPQQADKRVVLNADHVSYDSDLDIATARGHVQITQGLQVLTADVVSYNQDTDQVTASGNVVLRDSTGDIYFGDYMEMRNNMSDGFIDQVKGILVGDTRVIGNTATRRDTRYVDISNGTYSPCLLCKDDPNQPLIWQLQARQVEHDSEEQELYYYDATLQFYGVPLLYTPYFSSPDPTVKQRDGFLSPEGGDSSTLGYTAREYYYYGISPQEDLTLEGGYASLQGPLMGFEYRDRLDYGKFVFSGSIAEGADQYGDSKGNSYPDRTERGHIFGLGIYDLSDDWRAGFNVARTTDDTYLRQYGYSDQDLLDNRLYVEGFFDRNYAVANVYSAQDLRPGLVEGAQPVAAPYANYQAFGNQGETLGGRWDFNAGTMVILRPGGENLGTLGLIEDGVPVTKASLAALTPSGDQNVERVSSSAGWQRTIIADGFSNEVDSHIFVDGYESNNHPNLPEESIDTDTGSDTSGRATPQFHDVLRYPMVSQDDGGHWLVEPIGSFSFAPTGLANNNHIPNEDSLDLELDANNLFDANRFPGIDRIEDGAHASYGLRTGYYLDSGGYATMLFGQSRRLSGANIFPTGSGLDTPASDYVTGIDVYPGRYVTVGYQGRFDHRTFGSKLHQVNFSFVPDPDKPDTVFGANYLFLSSIPTINSGQNRNNLSPFISQKLGPYWTVVASVTSELGNGATLQDISTTTTYQDDCLLFQIVATRDLTNSIGGLNGTSIFFRIGLKTLGVFQSSNLGGIFPGRTTTVQ